LTDTNFLLQSRYDWGPVALAFLLRMIFIGVWLKHLDRSQRDGASFLLGMIVGVAMFEKLSSTVLVGPLAMILLMDCRSTVARNAGFAVAGILVGSLPVIAVNIYSLLVESRLLALSATFTSTSPLTLSGYVGSYVALGNGEVERQFLFTVGSFPWARWLEGVAVVSLMVLVGVFAWRRAEADEIMRIACVAVMSYLSIGVGLRYLPAETAEITGLSARRFSISRSRSQLFRFAPRPLDQTSRVLASRFALSRSCWHAAPRFYGCSRPSATIGTLEVGIRPSMRQRSLPRGSRKELSSSPPTGESRHRFFA
jgi:hypothetical protein